MKYIISMLALETTRRCNLNCAHCMRGLSQNVDLSKDIVDRVLSDFRVYKFSHILFSGGEPTLNPDIIVYTIDKIISENIDVYEIAMVTNGQIFNKDIVDAFNRFNDYRNKAFKKMTIEERGEEYYEKYYAASKKSFARISFSVDKYHHPIPKEVRDNYEKYAKGIELTDNNMADKKIIRTGNASFGEEFEYTLAPIMYTHNNGFCNLLDFIYVTANGLITSESKGEYIDMDIINMGSVFETNIEEIVSEYASPIFENERINFENKISNK